MAKATFAAGCFWGVEARFRQIPGVIDTRVGYTGGSTPDPDYKLVCTGLTGHAEAIEVNFDPRVIDYEQLLIAFWHLHDPTTPNQQGPDIGTQYRSAVFYHDEVQRQIAEQVKASLNANNEFGAPIVTEITAAEVFYPAEEYHQRYIEKQRGGD